MTVPRLHGSIVPAAAGSDESALLVLLPSLGTTTSLWDGVVDSLRLSEPALRILRLDLPGHGSSPATAEPFTIAELAEATLRLVDEVGGGRFWLAGVSLGGTIGLELAAQHPDRVRGLALFSSGARIAEPPVWVARAAQVRSSGTASLVTGSAERWFAPDFLGSAGGGSGARALDQLVEVDDESYALCTDALAAFDRRAALGGITPPVICVSGEFDPVTTPESMAELAAALPNARSVDIAGSSHLSVLERPAEAAAVLVELVGAGATASTAQDDAATERGMRVRRAVLGDAHVDAATAAATAETAPFQDFITRYAWGEIWSRPGLTRGERSIATLAVLVADGHEHELRMHVLAALRNGLSRAQIGEIIMHTALYAGLPAANRGLAIMREAFITLDEDGAPES